MSCIKRALQQESGLPHGRENHIQSNPEDEGLGRSAHFHRFCAIVNTQCSPRSAPFVERLVVHAVTYMDYKYSRILDNSSFRLLGFVPDDGRSNSDGGDTRIRLTLHEHNTEDTINFRAVSYVWGCTDRQSLRTVFIDNQALQVTLSCFELLLYYRDDATPQDRLFVDQVCIDQSNDNERGHQVALMGHIFAQAHSVISWLGPSSDARLGHGISALHELHAYLNESLHSWRQDLAISWPKREVNDVFQRLIDLSDDWKYRGSRWTAISHVYFNPYFTRLWIAPEMMLARVFEVRAGPCAIDGDVLLMLNRAIQSYEMTLGSLREWFDPHCWMQSEEMMIVVRSARGLVDMFPLSWRIVYQRLTVLDASDERDHIYALLSLKRISGCPAMPPDYTINTKQANEQLAQALIQAGTCLDFLRLAGTYTSKTWSSWLPSPVDCLAHIDARFLRMSSLTFCAGRYSAPFVNIDTDQGFLESQGKDIGTMIVLSRVFIRKAAENTEVLSQHLGAIESQLIDAIDAVLQTIVAALPEQTDIVRVFHRVLRPVLANVFFDLSNFRIWWKCVLDDRTKSASDLPRELLQFRSVLARAGNDLADFRFTVTDSGYLGIVHAASQQQDHICILMGADVPFSIRPVHEAGHFTLIRSCAVGGLMEGQAAELNHIPTTSIIFR